MKTQSVHVMGAPMKSRLILVTEHRLKFDQYLFRETPIKNQSTLGEGAPIKDQSILVNESLNNSTS